MDKTLFETKLNDLWNFVGSGMNATKDFVAEQAPLVVKELVAWVFWSNLLTFVVLSLIFATLIGILVVGVRSGIRQTRSSGGLQPTFALWIPVMIISLVALVPVGIYGGSSGLKALKAHVAPRLVVIDEVQQFFAERDMMKGTGRFGER